MKPSPNVIAIQIRIKIGERTMSVSSTTPIVLSGDQRRHRKQIAEHVANEADILSRRFDGGGSVTATAGNG